MMLISDQLSFRYNRVPTASAGLEFQNDMDTDEFYQALSYQDKDKGATNSFPASYSISPSLISVINAKKQGVSFKNYTSISPYSEFYPSSLSDEDDDDSSSFLFDRVGEDEEEYDDTSYSQPSTSSPTTSFFNSVTSPVTLDDHPLASTDEEEEELEFCYCNNSHDEIVTPKRSKSLINLAKSSLKRFTNFAQQISQQTTRYNNQSLNVLNFNARETDDKFLDVEEMTEMQTFNLPVLESKLCLQQEQTQEQDSQSQEELMTVSTTIYKRHRENRINSKFLRIYAHDLSSKLKGDLIFSDDELDYQIASNVDTEMLKLSSLAREKLWSNVVLPPRSDEISIASFNGNTSDKGVVKTKENQIKYHYTRKGSNTNRFNTTICASSVETDEP